MTEYAPLTQGEFRQLCEYLYRRTGMSFTEAKRYYVERRVAERMAETGSVAFPSYFALLRADLEGEIEHFINAFTVNETYFYREDHQLRCLTKSLLSERLNARSSSDSLRIWSAPCSTGEEAYSIAIWLLENWPLVDQYDIEIIASDIDTRVLEQAKAGAFGKRALMRLPPDLVERYFRAEAADAESWRIIDELRDSVAFSRINIVDPAQTRTQGRFDVIFCRNVLIYFDEASRRVTAENLFDNLKPGGFICLGHTESMSRISALFDVRRFDEGIVYQRPYAGTAGEAAGKSAAKGTGGRT